MGSKNYKINEPIYKDEKMNKISYIIGGIGFGLILICIIYLFHIFHPNNP